MSHLDNQEKIPVAFDILKSKRSIKMEYSKEPFLTVQLKNGSIFFTVKLVRELKLLPNMKVAFSVNEQLGKAYLYFDHEDKNGNGYLLREASSSQTLRICSTSVVDEFKKIFFQEIKEDSQRLFVNIISSPLKIQQKNMEPKKVMAYELNNFAFMQK